MSINRACSLLGYSKQAYHKREKKTAIRAESAETVIKKVGEIRTDMPRLGTRKLYYLLNEQFKESNLKVGRDKLFSILKSANLLIVNRKCYIRTTNSSQWQRKHKNLIVDLIPQKPEEVLVCDITYANNGLKEPKK